MWASGVGIGLFDAMGCIARSGNDGRRGGLCGRNLCRDDRLFGQVGNPLFAVIVVSAGISGLTGTDQFLLEGLEDARLNRLPAVGVDGMRDVGVEFGASVVVLGGSVFLEVSAALVAVHGAQVVLRVALRATIGQLSAGHRHEGAFGALNDLQIPNHETGVECDRAEPLQAIVWIVHEFNPNFCDFHGRSPYGRL